MGFLAKYDAIIVPLSIAIVSNFQKVFSLILLSKCLNENYSALYMKTCQKYKTISENILPQNFSVLTCYLRRYYGTFCTLLSMNLRMDSMLHTNLSHTIKPPQKFGRKMKEVNFFTGLLNLWWNGDLQDSLWSIARNKTERKISQ